ncbi:MAG TPA: PD-(D/E)XK nuclease family protein [Nitrospirae bacterium]|nr:PD-(D/E)XK nuclease family protein [Nitrospirota bacterium]
MDDRKRTIHKGLGPCYIPPVMMTLRQISKHVAVTFGNKSALPEEFAAPLISSIAGIGIGYATLAAEFIREIKHKFPGADNESMAKGLESVFEKENTPDEVTKRVHECLDIMDLYNSSLERAGLSDSSDMILSAAGLVHNLDISLLVLDGFYEMTPVELKLAKALTSRADNTLALIPISHQDDDLSYCYSGEMADQFGVQPELVDISEKSSKSSSYEYFPAKGLEEEVEAMARDIKANYINSRNRDLDDTWIVFPKIAPYRAMCGRILGRYGIPHSFFPASTLAESPAYRDLISVLESVFGGYRRVPFSRMLHSPFFSHIPLELKAAVPSVSLSSGLAGGEQAWRKAFKSKGLLKEFNTVLKILKPLKSSTSTASFGSFLNVLLDVLARLGFDPSGEGLSKTEDVLGSLVLLDSVEGIKAGPAELIEATKRALGSIRSPREGSGVRVCELFDVRGLHPAKLYLGGLKDGDLPAKPDMDFILPERIRSALGLVDMDRFMHLQWHIFRRLCATSGSLSLSYPKMDGDKLYLPSIYLSGGTEKDLSVKGIYCEEELQTYRATAPELPKPKPKEVSSIAFAKEGTSIRVTDIDSYRSCPRRHFIEKVLGLTPPEVQQYEIDARELGIIAHRVMEGLISGPLPSLETFTERAGSILDDALNNSELDKYLADIMKESFLYLLDDIYALEQSLEEEDIKSHELEVDVRGSINGINLRGKIDRIDNNNDNTVSLMDYKTGASEISAVSALRGENLQLFIYAGMLAARGRSLKRVGIYSLKDIRLKWVPNQRDLKNGNDINTLIDAASTFLKETAAEMAHGSYPALPLKEDRCINCHERPFCPYIQGAGESLNV